MSERAEVDLYGVLGVARDATAHEIRRAYRRLARQHHPDLNARPEGPQRFATLAHAYEILGDPVRRARYDHALAPSTTTPRSRRPESPRQAPVGDRIVRRGILELSPHESAHLAHHSVVLRDMYGQTIVLPAGTGHGDQVTMFHDGHPAVVTVRFAQKP